MFFNSFNQRKKHDPNCINTKCHKLTTFTHVHSQALRVLEQMRTHGIEPVSAAVTLSLALMQQNLPVSPPFAHASSAVHLLPLHVHTARHEAKLTHTQYAGRHAHTNASPAQDQESHALIISAIGRERLNNHEVVPL